MIGTNKMTDIKRRFIRMAVLILAVFIAAGGLSLSRAHADDGSTQERPVREVHNVEINGKLYCFFATHYIVLTPDEITGMTDEELTSEILKRSGLYMKEANCHNASHKAVSPEDWAKKGGTLFLSPEDIENIRNALPSEGEPVKLQMDLNVTTEPLTEETEVYSTSKGKNKSPRLSPRLLFAAVATPEDAAYGEEICEEETPKKESPKVPKQKMGGKIKGGAGEAEEMLPEYRTISMTDRSGAPVEETLKDGDPVKLEWIEPGKKGDMEGKTSFFRRYPAALAGIALCAAAAVIAAVIIRRRGEEDS